MASCIDCEVERSNLSMCRLHAAAPALLEALEAIERVHFDLAANSEMADKARAAIRAAKGEST